MPHNPQSLQLTNQYRERLNLFRERLQREAQASWPTIEEFDASDWTPRMARAVERAQVEALRATAGYLSAFLSLELGKPTKGPTILSQRKAGVGAEGKPLAQSLESPRIGVLWRLKEGSDSAEALQYGLDRAKRQVGMDFDTAHRSALLEAINGDNRFAGWQRATSGTCAACLGTAHGPDGGLNFPVHPGCQCVSEPIAEPRSPHDSLRGKEMRGLTPEDKAAVKDGYLGTGFSRTLNEYLRSGEIFGTSSEADVLKVLGELDQAFAHTGPLGVPVQVQRTINGSLFDLGVPIRADDLSVAVGKSFTDRGFTSTAAAEMKTPPVPGTRFILNVSPEVKAIWGANPAENELLLERGCRFLIRSIKREDGGGFLVEADVLPPA